MRFYLIGHCRVMNREVVKNATVGLHPRLLNGSTSQTRRLTPVTLFGLSANSLSDRRFQSPTP